MQGCVGRLLRHWRVEARGTSRARSTLSGIVSSLSVTRNVNSCAQSRGTSACTGGDAAADTLLAAKHREDDEVSRLRRVCSHGWGPNTDKTTTLDGCAVCARTGGARTVQNDLQTEALARHQLNQSLRFARIHIHKECDGRIVGGSATVGLIMVGAELNARVRRAWAAFEACASESRGARSE